MHRFKYVITSYLSYMRDELGRRGGGKNSQKNVIVIYSWLAWVAFLCYGLPGTVFNGPTKTHSGLQGVVVVVIHKTTLDNILKLFQI